jgi:enoyl-CoA hydratase
LDRPEVRNALDLSAAEALLSALAAVADDDDTAVVILTGTGGAFCAGADLPALVHAVASTPALEVMRRAGQTVRALHRLPQLTIAAVDGPAVGAGWGLAMACDIRIAGARACFKAPFVQMGLGPDYGLSSTLPGAVGHERALELLMTGRTVDPQQALQLGLLAEVADDAFSCAVQLAARITTAPKQAIRSAKASVAAAGDADFDDVVDNLEATAQAALLAHPDFADRIRRWMG